MRKVVVGLALFVASTVPAWAGDRCQSLQAQLDAMHQIPTTGDLVGFLKERYAVDERLVRCRDQEVAARVAKERATCKRLGGVEIGMTEEQVLATCYGMLQRHVHRTEIPGHVHEQWVYPGYSSYLYFDDGILTGIQN